LIEKQVEILRKKNLLEMAAKSDKEKSSKKDALQKSAGIKKSSAKSKKTVEKDDFDLEDDKTKPKAGKISASALNKDDEDNNIDDIEVDDSPIKAEDDEDWDPDFDEFDLPKSSKKTLPIKKGSRDSDDDFKVDDEFKDLFSSNSSSKKYNEDDDY